MSNRLFINQKGINYFFPFLLIAVLFLLSGYTNSLLDVLNKYFQQGLQISRAQSGLVQFALYGGYFLMAVPAGWGIRKWGYNKGIIIGLFILIGGCLGFIPGAYFESFPIFLFSLFVIACGFAFFETTANPLATFLGPESGAERRLNLAQSFNGLGWILGPLLGGLIVFSNSETGISDFSNLPIPFIILGVLVLIIAVFLIFKPLPQVQMDERQADEKPDSSVKLLKQSHFIWAVIAQFFYVASQTGVNSFFINYTTETNNAITNQQASVILAFGGMGLFVLGRFTGSWIMKWWKAPKLLALYSGLAVLMMVLVIIEIPWVSIVALILTYLFMSIMYPTIFALGIKGLGTKVSRASSILVMAIVGGAVCPMIMGHIADVSSMALGFIIPLVGFAIILYFGLFGHKIRAAYAS